LAIGGWTAFSGWSARNESARFGRGAGLRGVASAFNFGFSAVIRVLLSGRVLRAGFADIAIRRILPATIPFVKLGPSSFAMADAENPSLESSFMRSTRSSVQLTIERSSPAF